jgi:dihydrofolate synthase/folylpolyglutamate synthase
LLIRGLSCVLSDEASIAVTYEQAIAGLQVLGFELHAPQDEFELDSIRAVLGEMGDPQTRFPSVLIAGTNGKGSTAATLASILAVAGYRTALYTSPHLVRVNERIQVNGEEISNSAFATAYEQVEAAIQRLLASGQLRRHLSYFEVLTAIAFACFAEQRVDVTVLEVGLGGRLDATNVVDPSVSVIADIALDHQEFLGNTMAEIAREKAGIIRPGRPIVTLPQVPEVDSVLARISSELGAQAVNAASYLPSGVAEPVPCLGEIRNRYAIQTGEESVAVDSPLLGGHQRRNLALAMAAAGQLRSQGMRITRQHIEQGIRETRWPGRCEFFPATGGRPDMLLDGAHNPAGAWTLRNAIDGYFRGREITLVFGVARDKAVRELAEILFPLARKVVATQADNPRAASPEEIRALTQSTGADLCEVPRVNDALKRACELASYEGPPKPTGLVVVAGSLYIVGKARSWIGESGNCVIG